MTDHYLAQTGIDHRRRMGCHDSHGRRVSPGPCLLGLFSYTFATVATLHPA